MKQYFHFVFDRDKSQDRANMLRNAFAAQRLDRTSEGTYSFDSSTMDMFGTADEEDSFPAAEDFLLELGFGGPPQGLERIPERFLQSSQVCSNAFLSNLKPIQDGIDLFRCGESTLGNSSPPSKK